MKMGANPATVYFQKLEWEVKLVGRREDMGPRGMMAAAVHWGVPYSYTSIIANMGIGIPQNYDKWKEQLLIMYEEREQNKAYNDAHNIDTRQDKKLGNFKQITATSSKSTTGGATSSSMGKTTGSEKGHDMGGRWMTPTGMDTKMQIDARKQKQRNEERCFKCDEKGYLSRDCPTKKVAVRAVEATPVELLSKDTKIKEVKE